MGGYEVDRHLIQRTIVKQIADPRSACSRWAADPETLVHVLQRNRGLLIQFEVVALGSGPEEGKVCFIPDLKIPTAHLRDPVSFDAMSRESIDKLTPLRHVFRNRDVPTVKKCGTTTTSQCAGHEA